MRYLKKFLKFIKEAATAEAPSSSSDTEVKPGQPLTKPKAPTKPTPPKRKEDKEKIQQPTVDPQRKAVTEMDVVNRFIEEMNKKGESIKKYM